MIAGLPYDAEVEYIESDGTQFFKFPLDTSTITRNLTGKCRIRMFNAGNAEQDIYGIDSTIVSGRYNDKWFMWWRSSFFVNGRNELMHDVVYEHDIEGCSITVDGTKTTSSLTSQFNYTQKYLWIFCSGENRMMLHAQVASLQFFVDGQIVGNLIPVRFTNELGQAEGAMYDRVSRTLFRNQGTGDPFVLGPDKAATSVPVMGLHFMRRPRYTAKDYVQGGLVAMWDGIENAGWGAHDSNATVWKDLLGGGDSELTAPRWNEDSFFLTRLYYQTGHVDTSAVLFSAMASASILSNGYSFQMSTKNNGTTSSFHQIFGFRDSSTVFLLRQSDWVRRFYSAANGYVWGLGAGNYAGTITITKDVNDYRGFINSNSTSSRSLTPGTYTPDGDVSIHIGGLPDLGSNMRIDVCCVRLYSRALTAAEIAANYAVDKERFNLP